MESSDNDSKSALESSGEFSSGVLLTARSINKEFADKKILENISLTIEEGQIVTLIGPNGAGKTTLVRIALGLLQPDSGAIYHRPALRIGYMPQKVQVEPTLPLTVSRFLQLANRHDRELLGTTLSDLKISHLQHHQLTSISGGEMQRVLLARALLRKPELLILDEPAQGVDLGGQAELYRLISDISDSQGCGVLMISHDLHLVMSSTDEVICLNHHVCCHGKPEHVSNDPAYLNLFGASASGDLAVYTHHHDHEHGIGGGVKEHHHD